MARVRDTYVGRRDDRDVDPLIHEGAERTMAQEQPTLDGPKLQHPGARRWSPRLGRFGALLTLLIPLGMLIVGWSLRGLPNLPVPQTRPGRLPEAHWEGRASLTVPRGDFGLAVAGGQVWVLGGTTGARDSFLASSEIYDPAANSWRSGPDLPAARRAFGTVAIGETVYVIGGTTASQGASAGVDALDTRTNQWRSLAPLPSAVSDLAVVESGGTIYALGGANGGGAVDTAFAYNPAANAWSALAPLPTPRSNLAAVVLSGKIYALGGLVGGTAGTTMEIFDPATGRWATGPAMLGPMADFGATALDGRIHAVQGAIQQVYDPRANKWVTDSPMATGRQSEGLVTVGDTLYAIGGLGTEAPTALGGVEAFVPGEASEPDNFQLLGTDRGGAIAVILGIILTVSLMLIMLRLGRRRPEPPDDAEAVAPPE